MRGGAFSRELVDLICARSDRWQRRAIAAEQQLAELARLLACIVGGDYGPLCDHPADCACTAAQAIRLLESSAPPAGEQDVRAVGSSGQDAG